MKGRTHTGQIYTLLWRAGLIQDKFTLSYGGQDSYTGQIYTQGDPCVPRAANMTTNSSYEGWVIGSLAGLF